MLRDKGLWIGIIITAVLIGLGVYFFSKPTNSSQSDSAPISSNILVPEGDYQTSGISNGAYLPASPSAKLTVVEFGDYECPACGLYQPLVKKLLTDFAGQVNFVFRNFPLSQHANAQISAQAVEAAGLQGKFWEMHDKVYESQKEWADLSDPKDTFIGYATGLGLDTEKYKTDIESADIKKKIQSDYSDGTLIKLNATPTFYLNGKKIETLPSSYDGLKKLVSDALAQ